MATLARPTSRVLLRCKPGSRADKAAIAFLIFVLSGAAHAVVAWRTAEGSEIRDIAFYVANFAAAAAEVSVSRAFWGSHCGPALQRGICLQEYWILTDLRQAKSVRHNNLRCRRCSKRHKATQKSGVMEAGGEAEEGCMILMLGNTWAME
ncbi:uncharacterized protein VDAG_01297 [Verticillium dahliae VdLs.17]|uniref:Uncharacterized protein n=1 Tax=Verticillium dahliae (strain VdLs.17 / ATCC MYA-4575 / FGSC 10137) TaxID=498257 RepID=G2WU24_VERDV|nr:uncharacterized protein VDAG_01297 [Verticillium dahliae VdLs.17]EGY17615.1 hypothetical protein VDAG_01297 [Verticillium dahliae VdLs.17]